MKRLFITALISMVAVGTATADITSDLRTDLVYGSTVNSEVNFNNMPATAAGRSNKTNISHNFGGMQDSPSERVSGI
ncbi:MAG: hypothetical protein OQK92_10320 [Sedimenticola sp.]|nr:hypothetical protein [Sedimenticola sp.]